MQVAEVPVVSARGINRLREQAQKACLQLQVLKKCEVFFKLLETGKITDLNVKTDETQLFGGVTQVDKSVISLAPGGIREIYLLSDGIGVDGDANLCVWRSNKFGTGWIVIPAKHIASMSLDELNLFMEVKLP